ncbi:MAG: hypothetical protein U1F19_08430 [Lysobacterales bacterium]
MAATTPNGWRNVRIPSPAWPGIVSLSMRLACSPKPFQKASRIQHFAPRLRKRLSLLGGHQHGQIILMVQHQVEHAAQHARALAVMFAHRRNAACAASMARRVSSGTHVWHRAQQRACGGVAYFAGTAGRGRTPLACNQCLVAHTADSVNGSAVISIFSIRGFILYSASSTGFLR